MSHSIGRPSTVPFTYIIDYRPHLGDPDYLRLLSEAPPDLLHVAYDALCVSRFGPSLDMLGRKADLLPPSEVDARNRSVRAFADAARAAGVEQVVPYICNQTIGGHPEERTGFWAFYDRWDDYEDTFGSKPAEDPVRWLQRDPNGEVAYNYPFRFPAYDPPFRLAPCPNNPHWRRYLHAIVSNLAACGYDGIFIDNNILHCYCEYCQNGFHDYLASRYDAAERRRRFGREDPSLSVAGDRISWALGQPEFRVFLEAHVPPKTRREKFGSENLREAKLSEAGRGFLWGRATAFLWEILRACGHPEEAARRKFSGDFPELGLRTSEDRALWVETQKFWAHSIADFLSGLKAIGRTCGKTFPVIPNWGMLHGARAADYRRLDAKNVRDWTEGCDFVMFEEEYFPGRLSEGVFADHIVGYKYTRACGNRAVVLPYRGGSPSAIALAHAEAAAFSGGGAFVQPAYVYPEIRAQYGTFFKAHAHLYEGTSPVAPVGLTFCFDEVHGENLEHLRQVYRIAYALGAAQIPFEILIEDDLKADLLGDHRAVILPHIRNLSDRMLQAAQAYLASGGSLLVTGETGVCFDDTKPRPLEAVRTLRTSQERLAYVADLCDLIPLRVPEVYDILDLPWEDERAVARAAEKTGPIVWRNLAELLKELCGESLSVLKTPGEGGLRVERTTKKTAGKTLSILHLLNYDVPGPGCPVDGPLRELREIPCRIPLKEAAEVRKVLFYTPEKEEDRDLPWTVDNGYLCLSVPELRIYAVVAFFT